MTVPVLRQRRCALRGTVWLAVVVGLALSACSSPDEPVSSPINNHPAPSQPVPPRDKVPRDDLSEERVVIWDTAEVVAETKIRVTFWAGTHRCFSSRYVVRETDHNVAIAVIEGKFPQAPRACTEEARQASLVVETTQPVGQREIVPLPDPPLEP